MQTEDLYPNDSTYFGVPVEPKEQVIARKKEKAQTLEAAKVIDQIMAHFDERISYRNSLDSITIDQEQSPELHLRACITNGMIKTALLEERNLLEELLDIHAKNLS